MSQYRTTSSKSGAGEAVETAAPTEEKNYTYGNSTWQDLLTSVTYGDTVHTPVYDEIGNPTTYGNGEQLYTNLTWEHGRQLASLTTNNKTYTYDYDVDGIRNTL